MKNINYYDIVYITNIPAFYKINLFNRISDKRNILVIFLKDSEIDRNYDFYKGERNFKFISLGNYGYIQKVFKLFHLIRFAKYKKLIVGGFDYKEYWMAVFMFPKRMNAIVIESSIYESSTSGIKGFLKRIFLNRISTAYLPGKAHKDLALALGFKGELKITKGVGIFNITQQPIYCPKYSVSRFIYVGRLSEEKNLKYLVLTFNEFPGLQLNIVGFGPQDKELKSIAKNNIVFHGAIDNKVLPEFYQSNDVFILPSKSETWGLVIEEAFNNGLPVIVSNMVGCSSEIITNDINGIIFQLNEKDGLKKAILKITNVTYYNSLLKNVCNMDFNMLANEQIKCYF